MADFFNSLQETILSHQKAPTIVNEESKFVVVTYWWGAGNANANIARPCMMYYEDFITKIKKLVHHHFGSMTENERIVTDDINALLRISPDFVQKTAAFVKLLDAKTKEFYDMIYIDVGTDHLNKNPAAQLVETKKRLMAMVATNETTANIADSFPESEAAMEAASAAIVGFPGGVSLFI